MPRGKFVFRNSDNSAVFSVKTDTFEPGDFIVIDGNLCKVMDYLAGKLRALSPNGIVEEVEAVKKQTRKGKQIQTIDKYEKRSKQKTINIGTVKNLQKFQIGVLGDMSEVKSGHRAPVCAIKLQSEKRKGRKQPKRNKNGLANPSTNETM